eukprot:TRINITY_DN543_c1_g4_i4.p1 TRINITY_DN543_c1_g4~~TRINITY_DN543_c1_g4_i4.p1  ORF type:complete len:819 (-),score=153.50 TRINITY_DN543_c1_g4_i4:387-2843(-)
MASNGNSAAPRLANLHGTLHVQVLDGTNLPNRDTIGDSCKCTCFGGLVHSDCYTTIMLGTARVASTRVINNSANPTWNETFVLPVAHVVSEIKFLVKDSDLVGSTTIGVVSIPAAELEEKQVIEGSYNLAIIGKEEGAQLRVKLHYIAVAKDPRYRNGVGAGPEYPGVPHCYFPLRRGCRTVLYQDAHVGDNLIPPFKLGDGTDYKPANCWEDQCKAMLAARHFIYIADWSFFDDIKLMRDMNREIPDGGGVTVGELLKQKAKEGVRVLLLVWDDKTSANNPLIKTAGVMHTHDEDTKKFFKHSAVRCHLAGRYADSKLSFFRQHLVGTFYTHHQKMMACDAPAEKPGQERQIVAFLGGIDLTSGRWDTPEHALFKTRHTLHEGDYVNSTFGNTTVNGGPREPWHDIHSRVEGPAALDVVTNFEERWKKSAHFHTDEVLSLNHVPWLKYPRAGSPSYGDSDVMVTDNSDPDTWHTQVFRSIDSGSVKGFPQEPPDIADKGLQGLKGAVVDKSIQNAYIHAIRSAQHFIYIENQYFLGSSYAWPENTDTGAVNLIPMEIALKTASKILAGERFAVYIVIPLWPEGDSASNSVKDILFFQRQTMMAMYNVIAAAIKEKGLVGVSPLDYLMFFCLGNREPALPGEKPPENPPPPESGQAKAQKNRRFMVYVHAKMMVVDDEYVIIGSANVNQRSMAGDRDTELAMGAYQPHHTWAKLGSAPRAQVHGFRMSLWAEHSGSIEHVFYNPSSVECARTMWEIGQQGWQQWTADETTQMKGHLMSYPYKFNDDGSIERLPGSETFPDVGGYIFEGKTELPSDLTC